MTDPRRSMWSALEDIWSDDHPDIRRMRDALRPVDAPGPSEPPVAPDTTPEPDRAAEESHRRRGRIAQLVAHVRAGELGARQLLEDLLR